MRSPLTHTAAGPLFAAATLSLSAPAQVIWINEFHYDNTGTDAGEFVELAVPRGWTDTEGVRLTLYNGGDGKPYGASHLLSSFTEGESSSAFTFFSKTIPGLQNGAPDGFAVDLNGSVQHFISYEGGFTAATGPAAGLSAIAIGVSESESSPAGASVGLHGSGSSLADFTWTAFAVATPGMQNGGQAAVPEPHEYALGVGAGLAIFAAMRRRHLHLHRHRHPPTHQHPHQQQPPQHPVTTPSTSPA